jgi:DNA-binding beta-propeller fold protein YncE
MKRFIIIVLAFVTLGARANAQCTDHFILVSTSDFSTGSTSSLDPVDKTPSINLESIHSDAVVRFGPGGLVYVVNRAGADNIQILDPCDNFNTVDQFSTGNGSGPHDIVFLSATEAYVTRYDLTSVLKMNPQTGATLGTINLASFADADGIPEMDQMFFSGGYLCVTLQRLDRNNFYSPTGASFLVVIDPTTDTVVDMDLGTGGVQPVTLLRTNPYSEVNLGVFQGDGIAYFSAVAFFGLTDGAVLSVNLDDPTAQAVVITESAAGGDILDVEIISDTKGFAIVATPSFTTELIAFNPTTGAKIGATMYAPGGYDLNDCEPSPLGLLLTDRKPTNPGIRCFDMATNLQIPGGPVDVGLPPFDILVNDGSPTAVGDTPISATRLEPNYPNPFNPETSIPFTLERDGRVTLRLYDVNGRVVATLTDGPMTAGEHVVRWNGRDARGGMAPSGVYFARLDANGATVTRALVLLK